MYTIKEKKNQNSFWYLHTNIGTSVKLWLLPSLFQYNNIICVWHKKNFIWNKPVSILYEYIVTTVSYHLSVETTNIVWLAFTILNCDFLITSNPDFFKIREGYLYDIIIIMSFDEIYCCKLSARVTLSWRLL